jgi:hypothetical protein
VTGAALTIWSVRAATVFYIAALALLLSAKTSRGRRIARLAWTAGCVCYLAHVYGAFEYFHDWSHAAAYAETARQTMDLFHFNWGGGLYFNYLFTMVWLGDTAWWWVHPRQYETRPPWAAAAIHSFLAFMFFNGAVVFAASFSRWLGAAATPALLWLWWRARRTARAG